MGHRRNLRFRWINSHHHHHHPIIIAVHVIFYSLFLKIPASSASTPPRCCDFKSLDALIRTAAMSALHTQRTGFITQVPLPSNYSGVSATALRLRTGTFYDRGTAASNLFLFPPGIKPHPFSRRIAFVFFNLGENLSPRYFQVPGYSLVAPVIGFSAYDSGYNFADPKVESLKLTTAAVGSILVRFPHSYRNETAAAGKGKGMMRCVKFSEGGLVQFKNITDDLICETEGGGQFTVVVPVAAAAENETRGKAVGLRRLIVIAAAAVVGSVCVVVIVVTSWKMARSNRIEKMEGEAEDGMAFDTAWIGRSKMPCASMVRTQPAIEHGYVP